MKVLLTGESGDLGRSLSPRLRDKLDTPVILDVRAPRDLKHGAVFIEGSILDRPKLTEVFRGCDCIVHIAASGITCFPTPQLLTWSSDATTSYDCADEGKTPDPHQYAEHPDAGLGAGRPLRGSQLVR
jgi:hypothetical protein